MRKHLVTLALLGLGTIRSAGVAALTTDEFFAICASAPVACNEHPILQAYVGGALDLLATLDEQTNYLGTIYCKDPKDLFDVADIMRFMESHREDYAGQNAMLLVVRYFEREGGCRVEP